MKLFVGDVLQLKKEHPCGSNQWEVLRTGMDFRIKCLKCAHSVMLPRVKLEKDIKKVIKSISASSSQPPASSP